MRRTVCRVHYPSEWPNSTSADIDCPVMPVIKADHCVSIESGVWFTLNITVRSAPDPQTAKYFLYWYTQLAIMGAKAIASNQCLAKVFLFCIFPSLSPPIWSIPWIEKYLPVSPLYRPYHWSVGTISLSLKWTLPKHLYLWHCVSQSNINRIWFTIQYMV